MPRGPVRRPPKPIIEKDIGSFLRELDHEELVALVMDEMKRNDSLFDRLRLRVAQTLRQGDQRLATFRAALEDAIEVDFVDYREAPTYFRDIDRVIDQIKPLVATDPARVAGLAEYAIRALEEAVSTAVDDSDGYTGPILADLVELHLAACRKARLDPDELGPRLLALELGAEYAEFEVVNRYAKVLGSRGLAAYRRAAEAKWAGVPPSQPGDDKGRSHDSDRFRLTQVMEALARHDGDLDALVAVKSRDLSSPYRFYQIAELYREADEHDHAMAWAERGTDAFPKNPDWRLQELLADEYHRRRRHADAMKLAWDHFVLRPGLESYKDLQRHAKLAGDWANWRDKAISHLRKEDRAKPRLSRDRSELVSVFLSENDDEAAWREASAGGCDDRLWMQLATKREADHPDDVVPVYRRLAEHAIAMKDNRSYAEAVALMKKVKRAQERLGDPAGFRAYAAEVRAAHRPKRNLIKLLDAQRW